MNEELAARVFHELGGLSAKMDTVIEGQNKSEKAQAALGNRVASLEHTRTRQRGFMAALTFLAGLIGFGAGRVA